MRVTRLAAMALVVALAAQTSAVAQDILQATLDRSGGAFTWADDTTARMQVADAPADTDWSRWAALHDGEISRLYAFSSSLGNVIYQFGLNPDTNRFELGFGALPKIPLVGLPRTASLSQFAMVHDGKAYRLYLQDRNDKAVLHQFGFNPGMERYEYGYRSLPTLRVTGFPPDTDWRRWAMLHDGQNARFLAFRRGGAAVLYQGGLDLDRDAFFHSWNAPGELNVGDIPTGVNLSGFALAHDHARARMFVLGQ